MRNHVEKNTRKIDLDDSIEEESALTGNSEGLLSDALLDLQKSLQNDFQAVQVQ